MRKFTKVKEEEIVTIKYEVKMSSFSTTGPELGFLSIFRQYICFSPFPKELEKVCIEISEIRPKHKGANGIHFGLDIQPLKANYLRVTVSLQWKLRRFRRAASAGI